ncbi:MAG: MBL fold metallo-hydrolase [Bacteroidota bacterium]
MNLRSSIRCFLLVAFLLYLPCRIHTLAQETSKPPGANYEGKAFTFQKIQDDIYHAIGTGNLAVWCNAAIIINSDDVLIVDSHVSPAAAWALLRELKSITSKPVRYVINTHFHFDHVHGNQVFPEDVEIIGHEFTREMIATGKSKSGRAYVRYAGRVPERIADLENQLISAADPEQKVKLQKQLFIYENYFEATNAVIPTLPNVTFKRSMTLYRGGREIRLLFLGRGHTGGDVLVYLPKERILITGDLLTAGLAYMGDGYLKEWAETLERLKKLEIDVILPGHGEPFAEKEKIDHFQAYLLDLWEKGVQMHRDGVSAQEAAMKIDMRSHAKNFPRIQEVGVDLHAVLRLYELLDEQE